MMPRLCPWLAPLLLAGCSVLYEPGQVPVKCPGEPPAPEWLEAVAGEQGGALRWRWPKINGVEARLCTSVPGGSELCQVAPCDAGECELVQTGLTDGVRITGRVLSVAACEETQASPSTSAAPFDTTAAAEWALVQSTCASTAGFVGGVLSLEQRNQGGSCSASLTLGEAGWADLTLDAELRISATGEGVRAGFVLGQSVTGARLRALAAVPTQFYVAVLERRVPGNAALEVVARGPQTLSSSEWTHVRLVVQGPVVSWQQGPSGGALTEALRWTDSGPRVGALGLTGDGEGRFEVRGLRVSSRAAKLEASPASSTWRFGVDGGLEGARVLGLPVQPVPCPAWPGACAECAPPPGDGCGLQTRSPLYIDYTLALLPQPPALDVTREVVVTSRFGWHADGGSGNLRVLDSLAGPLLDSASGALRVFGVTVADAGLAPEQWHRGVWTFAPDGGLAVTLDGQALPGAIGWLPPSGNRFLGTFITGNTFNSGPLIMHEVTVGQR